MKFIGYLFVRQLLAAAVIRRVVGDLLCEVPPELQVEYALELLQAVGKQFDSTERDRAQLTIILDRLNTLKTTKGPDGKPIMSKRVQFQVQDLVDLRSKKWVKKQYVQEAKLKEEVREDAEREEQAAATQGGKGGGS